MEQRIVGAGRAHVLPGVPRAAVTTAVAALALVAAAALSFRLLGGGALGIDAWWADLVGVTRGSMPYAIAVFCAEVGSGVGAAACGAIAAALLLALRRPRDAAALATAMVFGVAASELLKALALRPRPGGQLIASNGSAFPSGHSMGAAALAVALALVVAGLDEVPRRVARTAWAAAGAWIALMMWSRAALHVHWLTDTLAGAALGAAMAVLARALWARGAVTGPTAPRRSSPAPRR